MKEIRKRKMKGIYIIQGLRKRKDYHKAKREQGFVFM